MCQSQPDGILDRDVAQAELLLLQADFSAAAKLSLQLLQSCSQLDGPLAGRLLAVAFQSHWFQGRQEALLEELCSKHGGLSGLPLQAFILYQVLQLESGQLSASQQQVEARLQQHCSTTTSTTSPTALQGAGRQDSSTTDLAALCRLYAVDILCEEMHTPEQASEFLQNHAVVKMLQEDDLASLQAQVTAAMLTHTQAPHPPQGQPQPQPHTPHTTNHKPPPSTSDDPSMFCTMMGELNDADDDASYSNPAASRTAQGVGGCDDADVDDGGTKTATHTATPGHSSRSPLSGCQASKAALEGLTSLTAAAARLTQSPQQDTRMGAKPVTSSSAQAQATAVTAGPATPASSALPRTRMPATTSAPPAAVDTIKKGKAGASGVPAAEGASMERRAAAVVGDGVSQVAGSSAQGQNNSVTAVGSNGSDALVPRRGNQGDLHQVLFNATHHWRGVWHRVQLCMGSTSVWHHVSEATHTLIVAVVLFALYRERKMFPKWLSQLVQWIKIHVGGVLGMAFALTPNPMTSGHMPAGYVNRRG